MSGGARKPCSRLPPSIYQSPTLLSAGGFYGFMLSIPGSAAAAPWHRLWPLESQSSQAANGRERDAPSAPGDSQSLASRGAKRACRGCCWAPSAILGGDQGPTPAPPARSVPAFPTRCNARKDLRPPWGSRDAALQRWSPVQCGDPRLTGPGGSGLHGPCGAAPARAAAAAAAAIRSGAGAGAPRPAPAAGSASPGPALGRRGHPRAGEAAGSGVGSWSRGASQSWGRISPPQTLPGTGASQLGEPPPGLAPRRAQGQPRLQEDEPPSSVRTHPTRGKSSFLTPNLVLL